MAFKPWQFAYTPPPTVPPSSTVDEATLVANLAASGSPTTALPSSVANTNAGKLISRIADLADTSSYLQDAIVERLRATHVTFDFARDPEVKSALITVYGNPDPPAAISIPMYDHLLDAEVRTLQAEMELTDTAYQPNPVQAAAIQLLTSRVESNLIASGTFQNQLPTLLRPLKGDALMYHHWRHDLLQYPVIRSGSQGSTYGVPSALQTGQPGVLTAATVAIISTDTSNPVYRMLDQRMNGLAAGYSSMYSMMSTVSTIELGIGHVISAYVLTPIANLKRIVALFNGLKGLFHKPVLQGLADSVAVFAFSRLSAELGTMMFYMDRFVHQITNPILGTLGQLGALINQANTLYSRTTHDFNDAIAGLGSNDPCGKAPHKKTPYNPVPGSDAKNLPGLGATDALPGALASLASHLNWSTKLSTQQRTKVNTEMSRLLQRRQKEMGDRLDVMCSLRALDGLTSIAQGLATEMQRGTSFTADSKSQTAPALARLLPTIDTGNGSQITVQGSNIVIAPPTVPPAPDSVRRVLAQGGVKYLRKGQPQKINAQGLL